MTAASLCRRSSRPVDGSGGSGARLPVRKPVYETSWERDPREKAEIGLNFTRRPQVCRALESLSLDGEAANLQPLASLRSLARLSLRHNGLADLGALAGLVSLSELGVGGNRIADLRLLAGLARLQTLRLGGNGLAALHPLSGLGGLRDLGLAGNPVEDLRPLRAQPSLVWVHVRGSRIEDLAPLDGLPGLVVAGPDDRESPSRFGGSGGRAGQR